MPAVEVHISAANLRTNGLEQNAPRPENRKREVFDLDGLPRFPHHRGPGHGASPDTLLRVRVAPIPARIGRRPRASNSVSTSLSSALANGCCRRWVGPWWRSPGAWQTCTRYAASLLRSPHPQHLVIPGSGPTRTRYRQLGIRPMADAAVVRCPLLGSTMRSVASIEADTGRPSSAETSPICASPARLPPPSGCSHLGSVRVVLRIPLAVIDCRLRDSRVRARDTHSGRVALRHAPLPTADALRGRRRYEAPCLI